MKTAALIAISSFGLALSACDSAAENEVERTAEAIDESYEADATILENTEAGGPNEEAARQQADELRAKGEEIKDRLEDEADEMDATPQ